MRGGAEAIYDDMAAPIGLSRFAPVRPARGAMFSARGRVHPGETPRIAPVVSESEYHGG
jgi:hypothetical protein